MKLSKYIRILIVTFMFALLSIQVAWAEQANFSWKANNDSGITVGYMLHYGTSSREYTEYVDVNSSQPIAGRINASVSQLEPGQTYFFTVTAYNSEGTQSSYPNEIVYTVPINSEEISDNNTGSSDYELFAATSSTLSGGVALDGATVEGDVYVFTGPDTEVSSVTFSIDGVVARTEGYAPFELAGGATYDTSQLSPGDHEINADIKMSNGSSKLISAVFTIPSADVDPVSNNVHDIYISESSNLSGSVILEGATVDENMYVFTAPDNGVSRVAFSVDGVASRTEGYAPFELAGGASYDTSKLSPGKHEITANIELSDGGLEVVSAVFTIPSSNESKPNDSIYSIFGSKSSSLSGATDLDGTSVDGDIYVFTSPDTGVSRVIFSVDGVVTRTEGYAPFELAGGSAFDTSKLSSGKHEITANIELKDGSLEVVSAVFTIPSSKSNDSIYSIFGSESSYLSGATDLDGTSVDGDLYIFTSPDTGVSRVTFSVDGVVTRTEGYAPFELAGGAAFNTSQLSSGKHEIIASMKLKNGSSEEITATFTVQ